MTQHALALALHDAAHPDERYLPPGAVYATLAERIAREFRGDGGASLYQWLADRAAAQD